MKKALKRFLIYILVAAMLLSVGCGKGTGNKESGATKLSFKSTASMDYLMSLDGTTITINGYLATSSPADGSFIFLMNLPYQSCPFCVPNTSQLVNTLEVYPKKDKSFGFTNQAVSVTGTLVFAEDGGVFTDPYGYEFGYKLVDAEYTIITDADMTEAMQVYNKIADSGLISDLYAVYDYVYFTCAWPEYYVNSFTDADGNFVPGYYLWAGDVIPTIEYQYSYVTASYFDDLAATIDKFNTDGSLDVLKKNLEDAEKLAQDALNELVLENYTSELKYLAEFETEDYVFTLNNGAELVSRFNLLYDDFCNWINSYEL